MFLDEKPGSIKVNDLRCLVIKAIPLMKRYDAYVILGTLSATADGLFLRR